MVGASNEKERAEFVLQELAVARSNLVGLTTDLAKWLYASLLSVNLAGLAALAFDGSQRTAWDIWAGTGYLLGVLLAFLLGYFTIRRAGQAQKGIAAARRVAIAALTDATSSAEDQAKTDALAELTEKRPIWSELVGFGSLFAFLVATGLAIVSPSNSDAHIREESGPDAIDASTNEASSEAAE